MSCHWWYIFVYVLQLNLPPLFIISYLKLVPPLVDLTLLYVQYTNLEILFPMNLFYIP